MLRPTTAIAESQSSGSMPLRFTIWVWSLRTTIVVARPENTMPQAVATAPPVDIAGAGRVETSISVVEVCAYDYWELNGE